MVLRKHPQMIASSTLKADGTIIAAYMLLTTKGIRIVMISEAIANMVIIFDSRSCLENPNIV